MESPNEAPQHDAAPDDAAREAPPAPGAPDDLDRSPPNVVDHPFRVGDMVRLTEGPIVGVVHGLRVAAGRLHLLLHADAARDHWQDADRFAPLAAPETSAAEPEEPSRDEPAT